MKRANQIRAMLFLAFCLIMALSACDFEIVTDTPDETMSESMDTSDSETESLTDPSSETDPLESESETTTETESETASKTESETESETVHVHAWGEWVSSPAPTCTEPGTEIRSCVCGEAGSRTLEALGHHEVITPAVAPVACRAGLTEGTHCEHCGLVFTPQEEIPGGEHDETVFEAVLPTADQPGLTEGIHCSGCYRPVIEAVDPLRYSIRHGYDHLGTLENGQAMQTMYDRLYVSCLRFHSDATCNAEQMIDGQYAIAFTVDIFDLELSVAEMQTVWTVFYTENEHFFYWISVCYSWSYLSSEHAAEITICADKDYRYGADRRTWNLKMYQTIQAMQPEGETAYERTAYIHDTIMTHMVYAYTDGDLPSAELWAHNVIGYLDYGQGVCETYAEVFSLAMNYYGIPCIRVDGYADKGGGHSWNLVQMEDGRWYWFDLTYDDLDGVEEENAYDHTFFCVNDTEIIYMDMSFLDPKLHTYNTPSSANYLYPLPERAETPYRR